MRRSDVLPLALRGLGNARGSVEKMDTKDIYERGKAWKEYCGQGKEASVVCMSGCLTVVVLSARHDTIMNKPLIDLGVMLPSPIARDVFALPSPDIFGGCDTGRGHQRIASDLGGVLCFSP